MAQPLMVEKLLVAILVPPRHAARNASNCSTSHQCNNPYTVSAIIPLSGCLTPHLALAAFRPDVSYIAPSRSPVWRKDRWQRDYLSCRFARLPVGCDQDRYGLLKTSKRGQDKCSGQR
jgi:hypothetical protein